MKRAFLGVLLACGAGLSTCVGGLAVFCTSMLDPITFSKCLAFSAGVMVYVSFVEIFSHSVDQVSMHMTDAPTGVPYLIASLCFFGGWILISILDRCLHCFLDWRFGRKSSDPEDVLELPYEGSKEQFWHLFKDMFVSEASTEPHIELTNISSSSVLHQDTNERPFTTQSSTKPLECAEPNESFQTEPPRVAWWSQCMQRLGNCAKKEQPDELMAIIEKIAKFQFTQDQRTHVRLGLFTALALGIHNLPEGIATYSATVISPKIGVGMAIAIAIHNIPEGIAVAVPIYFSSGSKTKALVYTFISGAAEPVGALFCWGVMGDGTSVAVGMLFAVVCGIMVNVSLKELYPAALKYDPVDRVSSRWMLIGMAFMSLSLVIFNLTS